MDNYARAFEENLQRNGNSYTFSFPTELKIAYQLKTGHPVPMFWGYFDSIDGFTCVVLYDPIQCDFLGLNVKVHGKPIDLQVDSKGRMKLSSDLVERLDISADGKIVIQ